MNALFFYCSLIGYTAVSLAGHVTDLKDTVVTQVSLGKAHAVVLSSKGHVFTFGINNKGQCGREYVPGGAREREFQGLVSFPVGILVFSRVMECL